MNSNTFEMSLLHCTAKWCTMILHVPDLRKKESLSNMWIFHDFGDLWSTISVLALCHAIILCNNQNLKTETVLSCHVIYDKMLKLLNLSRETFCVHFFISNILTCCDKIKCKTFIPFTPEAT